MLTSSYRQILRYRIVVSKSSTPSEIFSRRLRDARERRGLSQGDLAGLAGLQAAAVSHFETGTRKPSFDNLRRLADALEISTDFLLGRADSDQALAGADTLHRHFDQLTHEDRKFAEELIRLLAAKSRDSE